MTPPEFDRLTAADLAFGLVVAALGLALAIIGWAGYLVLR